MTPARLARWASRFDRGRLRSGDRVLGWDGASPGTEAFGEWTAVVGVVRVELETRAGVGVKLFPGTALALPAGAVLALDLRLSEARRLAAPAVASVSGGAWSLRCGPVAVEAFDTLTVFPDGRLALGCRSPRRARRLALSWGSRALTAAVRHGPAWSRLSPWLHSSSANRSSEPNADTSSVG